MVSGHYDKASRLLDRTNHSMHQFEPFSVTILRRTLELLIDPNSERQRSLPPIRTEDQANTRLNQLNLEEIMLDRMGMSPHSLDHIFGEVVDRSSGDILRCIKSQRRMEEVIKNNINVFRRHCERAKATRDVIAKLDATDGINHDMVARCALIILLLLILAVMFLFALA
ncbi:uncharacterized protein LOC6526160 [Drosophila yakuba]|uniref:Uncharacterized protein n=1 Tax=Drosophila yakuba TaxID=7245 RepID=B4PZ19_DROYA|nr:uncharacterized protein LOC6526160 [Drosophila yakuba]EDX03080.2 uncharacterized protein Dyak_GE17915 [Drosophila yakuba]